MLNTQLRGIALVIRFALILYVLLCACTFANAQTPDPLDRVMTELMAGRTEKALAALDEAIKKYPTNADAYFLRGILKMPDDPSQALRDFDKVIELKPDSAPAYHQRAMIRLMKNDVAGALKDLDAAIAHNINDDSVYFLRGQLRWQLGDAKAALSDLNKSIKLNPNNPRSYSTRGDLSLFLQDMDGALADFNYLINWYETDPSARKAAKPSETDAAKSESQSVSASKNDDKPFRVELTQQTANEAPGAKEMAPTIANAYTNRGLILSSRGNRDAAISDFSKAIRVDPKNVWALYHRANEYEYKNDLPAALADIMKATQLEPENGNLVVEHGVLLFLLGRDKEAEAVFDVLLQSDRDLWQKRINDRIAAVKASVQKKQ